MSEEEKGWRGARCEELAQVLSTAFATPMGFPQGSISLKYREAVQHTWIGTSSAILSEIGTVQLEFFKLSQLTGNSTYADMAEKIIHNIHKAHPDQVCTHTAASSPFSFPPPSSRPQGKP